MTAALAPFNIALAQSNKLKVGVLLPKSGLQGLIGQSCQKGADLAPVVIRDLLGIDIELMNADTETNVDTARTRAEKLIQEGAHCLVGAFDSGAAAAIAQASPQKRTAGPSTGPPTASTQRSGGTAIALFRFTAAAPRFARAA